MKKVKYLITGMFGSRKEGETIDAYLLEKDIDRPIGILYHPNEHECASIGLAKYDEITDLWIDLSNESYVNISEEFSKQFDEEIKSMDVACLNDESNLTMQWTKELPTKCGWYCNVKINIRMKTSIE